MTKTLFFDETGYTGRKMMDTQQRVFAIASHDLAEDRCIALVKDIFGDTEIGELKYKVLRRRPAHQQRILALLEAVRLEGTITKTYVVDKRFALCQRIFDYFTETVLHAMGINIFQGAANIVICNQIYLDLVEGLGEESVDLILSEFEAMMNNRSVELYHKFWTMLEAAKQCAPSNARHALGALLFGRALPVAQYLEIPGDALDLSFTVMFALMASWQETTSDRFIVVHDESKNAEAYRGVWNKLNSSELASIVAGAGDYRSVQLPFRVDNLDFARSNDFAGLQIADCIAGAIAEVTRRKIGAPCKEDFADTLLEAGFDEVTNHILADRNWTPPPEALHVDARDPYEALIDIIGANYPH